MRAFAFFFALLLCGASAFAGPFFLQSQSTASRRLAILDDDGRIAFLYLTEPAVQKPVRDAVVYTRVAPVDKVDWDRIAKTGATPPLSADVASRSAVIAKPNPKEFAFKWSADGQSVAVLRKGVPIAMASMKEKEGFSKAVAKPSRLANPWSAKRYKELIGN